MMASDRFDSQVRRVATLSHRWLPGRATAAACLLAMATLSLCQAHPSDYAVAVTATVQASPPSIALHWPARGDASRYIVYRRLPLDSAWTTLDDLATSPSTIIGWTDTNVVPGAVYEYQIVRYNGNLTAYGYTMSAIHRPMVDDRGTLILIVDSSHAAALSNELVRLQKDLVGDGWTVIRHDVEPKDLGETGWKEAVASTKALIVTDYNADTNAVKAVLLMGHIPVPYSGQIGPDGHPDHMGTWPADVFYADMDGVWTDTSTYGAGTRQQNYPGDGKFDQSYIPYSTGYGNSRAELQVGRVDLHDMPCFSKSETELLRQYLDKDHNYRMKWVTTQPRGFIVDTAGDMISSFSPTGEAFAQNGWRNFGHMFGATNVFEAQRDQWFQYLAASSYQWAYGCGAGEYTLCSGVASSWGFASVDTKVNFTMLFGSYFGDWDVQNALMRSTLGTPTYTLSCSWAARPNHFYHFMTLGETLGECMRRTQNNTYSGPYSPVDYGPQMIHISLMGDPSLRMHVMAPASGLGVSKAAGVATLDWTASTESDVLGYHVYRGTNWLGPFTRLTASPATNTTYTDSAAPGGGVYYMVRPLKLEISTAGSYTNIGQGAITLINENATNHAPVAQSQSVTTAEETAHTITLAATDADSDTLTYGIVAAPLHGTLSGTAPNLTYTPASNYFGNDGFAFQAYDGKTDSGVGTISLTVTGIDDAPAIASVTAAPSPVIPPSASTLVSASAVDVDGNTLTYAWTKVSGPGSATFANAAAASTIVTFGQSGTYVLRATVSDGTTSAYGDVTVVLNDGGTAGDTTDDQLGTITARGENAPGETKERAFDNSGMKWLDFASTSWIQYQYPNGAQYVITSYTITSAEDVPGRDPRDWTLQGSNNGGETWTTLDTQSGQTWSGRSVKNTYTCSNATAYNVYRLDITANNGESIIQVAEIELIGTLGGGTPTVATPAFSPVAGTYTNAQTVTISTTTGDATIRYTTDGSTPSATVGSIYDGPVTVSTSMTLKAIACASGMVDSAVASAAYVIATSFSPLVNGSFETPTVATYQYNPSGATWTFTGSSGIQRNGSAWEAAGAPDGAQTAFLQTSGSGSRIEQALSLAAGTYAITFRAARRTGQIQPIRVCVDGAQVGSSITPTGNEFVGCTSATFTVTSGNHTIGFESTDNTGDKSSFIDLVAIMGGGGNATNHSPVISSVTAAPATITLPTSNTTVSVSASDVDGDTLTVAWTKASGTGTVSFANAAATNTTASFSQTGAYVLRATVSDGTASQYGDVTVTVNAVTPTNQAPVAQNQSVTTAEDTAQTITLAATDANGDALTYSIVAGPSHGSLSGTAPGVTYTPAANYSGSDTFTFRASDGQTNSTVATVSLTVTAVNDAPVISSVTAAPATITLPASNTTVSVSASDVDGDTLTVAWTKASGTGTASFGNAAATNTTVSFSQNGTYVLRATISDGTASQYGDVTVTVTPEGHVVATGGITTEVGGYRIHTFTNSGTLTVTSGGEVEVLVVGGGGGGGNGAGGGAGGLLHLPSVSLAAATYTVTVGSGGIGQTGNRGTKGSFSAIHSPAASAKTFRYVKWDVTAKRGADSYTGASEFRTTLSGSPVAWPAGTTCINPGGSNPGGEGPDKLIDGGGGTKWLSSAGTACIIDCGTGNSVTFDGYQYATGGDAPNRDPVSWLLYGSNDGSTWALIDAPLSETITTDRQAWTSVYDLEDWLFADGGGEGASVHEAGGSGGSGGGAGPQDGTPGNAVAGLGNNGGQSLQVGGTYPGGGGGGAGSAGGNAPDTTYGGAGGVGLSLSISGTATYYAGGGGGNGFLGAGAAAGGLGGGGNGNHPTGNAGTANTGGGGGASQMSGTGGNGGSGIVIVRFGVQGGSSSTNHSPVISSVTASRSTLMLPVSNTTVRVTASDVDADVLTVAWSKLSGPGSVTFGNATAPTTTVSFGESGNYMLRAVVSDGTASVTGTVAIVVQPAGTLMMIVDNSDTEGVTWVGAWFTGTAGADYYGANYAHDGNTAQGTKSVRFNPDLPADGDYVVSLRWTTDASHATNTPVDVIHAGITNTFIVNQQLSNGVWVALGSFFFAAGTNDGLLIRTTGASGFVIADAARFTLVEGDVTNASPVAQNQSVTTAEDTAQAITLAATDANGDALTYSIVAGPSHGALSGTAPGVTYTPAANYSGSDTFTFRASDGQTNSNVATVSLTVTAVNDAPVISSVTASVATITLPTSNTTVSVSASDVDGDTLTVAWTKASGTGTVSFANAAATNTTVSFSQSGTYVLRATISDGTASQYGDVTVTVNPEGHVVATGGITTEVDGYRIHTFTNSGTLTVTSGGEVEVLVVGGGGGGGNGAGGGAGGLLHLPSVSLTAATYTITVGSGGIGQAGNRGTKGSFSAIHSPAVSAKTFRYLKWEVTAKRGADSYTGASEFRTTLSGSPVAWPAGTTCINPGGSNPGGEGPDKLIDGNGGTKWLSSAGTTCIIDCGMGNSVTFDGYQYATGGDAPNRDPVSWLLYGSNDGSTWALIDAPLSETITTDRQAWTSVYDLEDWLFADGGGEGASVHEAGGSGGSGGGAGPQDGTPGNPVTGLGNNGGQSLQVGGTYPGGGGGGAGAAGGNAPDTTYGGAGGVGLSLSISGTATYYAGGGGGNGFLGAGAAAGGLGGGGSGNHPTGNAGTANTGGGGGASQMSGTGGNGGSGIVIVRFGL